ncbi:MAG: hypothetical protein QM758_08860 [Armatimonas sp.]
MLPRQWHGVWRGTLHIRPPLKNYPAQIPTELRITAEGGFAIVYDGQERPYTIAPVANEQGRFLLDEHNGITMEGFLDESTLYFTFTVDDTLLTTRYTLSGKTLTYEVRTYKSAGVTQPTGGTNKVTSWRHASVQTAILKKL